MSSRDRLRPLALGSRVAVALLALLLAPLAQAQYKVIGADGKVTYTDREPAAGRVTSLGARASAPATEPELPLELRQVNTRYPVTLYTTTGACEPCVSGRQCLRPARIPFNERQVVTAEDSEALSPVRRADAPTLMTAPDAARPGRRRLALVSRRRRVPKESRLPTNYQYRPPSRSSLARTRRGASALASDARPDASPTRPAAPAGERHPLLTR